MYWVATDLPIHETDVSLSSWSHCHGNGNWFVNNSWTRLVKAFKLYKPFSPWHDNIRLLCSTCGARRLHFTKIKGLKRFLSQRFTESLTDQVRPPFQSAWCSKWPPKAKRFSANSSKSRNEWKAKWLNWDCLRYSVAWKFCGSFILRIGDFLWFAGTNFCGSRWLKFLVGTNFCDSLFK